jgi:type 1 fimbria pilin
VKFRKTLFWVVELILGLTGAAFAQSVAGSGTASIAGVVTDQTGAVVVGATVKLTRGTELFKLR